MADLVQKKPAPGAADDDSDDEKDVQQDEVEQKVAEPEEDTTLANSDVTTKYQEAAKIAQGVLTELAARCVVGAKLVDLCKFGDDLIEERAMAVFRGKNKAGKPIERGIAFPVCLSVNECVCHCSPLLSDETYAPLAANDMVKVDLGVHVDGYIAVVAHTVIVREAGAAAAAATEPEAGPRANVLAAAWTAAEVAARMIKPGNTNEQVTQAVKKVAEAYGVKPMGGTLMHQMKRHVIDGNKMVLLRDDDKDQQVEKCTFEQYEVYAVDVCMTTGDGKPKEQGARTTVFKRIVDRKYSLRVKASRVFFNEINKRFPTLPFPLRAFPDEKAAKMGTREMVTNQLLLPYPVLYERNGDLIGHVKFTILLQTGGTSKVTGLEMPPGFVNEPKDKLPDDIVALLAEEFGKKKKDRKKKAAGGGGAAAAGADA
jgi:curved DNA binding protein